MLAARADQENAVHARQTAAAAKPLNQNGPGISAKTPGNRAPKTPFKVALNDENKVDNPGKGVSKNGQVYGGKQQGGKVEKNLFQTPAPRDRPALGFKTTNAKAAAFQTPARKTLGLSQERTQKRTVGRSRIQVHKEVKEAEPEVDWSNEEIQYIPPRPTALPDVPSDDEWDKVDFSILKTANVEAGRWAEFYGQRQATEAAQEAQWCEKERARMKKEDEDFYRKTMQDLREPESDEDLATKKIVALKQQFRPLGTVTSRSAASALSKASTTTPSYAAPTAATKAKLPITAPHVRPKNTPAAASARGTSHNTLGYAKGRAVSHTIKHQPFDSVSQTEVKPSQPLRKDPLRELETMILAREYEEAGLNENDVEDLSPGGVSLLAVESEDDEVFQMKMPGA